MLSRQRDAVAKKNPSSPENPPGETPLRGLSEGAVSKLLASAQLRVALESLPESTRRAHERLLHRLTHACGCEEGAAGALILVGIVLGRFLYTLSHWSLLNVARLAGQILLAFVVGGVAGKFLGLAVARIRLHALCQRIEREARILSP